MSHLHRQTRQDAREVVVVAVYEKTAGYLLPGDVVDVTRNAKNGLGLFFIQPMMFTHCDHSHFQQPNHQILNPISLPCFRIMLLVTSRSRNGNSICSPPG